jgi:hypothetical protein
LHRFRATIQPNKLAVWLSLDTPHFYSEDSWFESQDYKVLAEVVASFHEPHHAHTGLVTPNGPCLLGIKDYFSCSFGRADNLLRNRSLMKQGAGIDVNGF